MHLQIYYKNGCNWIKLFLRLQKQTISSISGVQVASTRLSASSEYIMAKRAHFPQLNPWQTESTMMRINAIMMPNTISLIFMFCSHIFLRICVPLFLKSCACSKQNISKTQYFTPVPTCFR